MKSDNPSRELDRTLLDWAFHSGTTEKVRGLVQAEVRKQRRRRKIRAAVAASALAIGFIAFWMVPFVRHTDTLATRTAQRTSVVLPDGSSADLNSRTVLRTDFRYDRRTVKLSAGEAYFAIAKNPERPFIVETPAGRIRVTGTEFNVRLDPAGRAEISLLEGEIRVESAEGPPTVLKPNEQFVTGGTAPRAMTQLEHERAIAWRENRFIFDGLPLGEAVAQFAAHHDRTVHVDDSIATLRPGGSCPLNDFPGFLQALKDTLPVQVREAGDGSYRIDRR